MSRYANQGMDHNTMQMQQGMPGQVRFIKFHGFGYYSQILTKSCSASNPVSDPESLKSWVLSLMWEVSSLAYDMSSTALGDRSLQMCVRAYPLHDIRHIDVSTYISILLLYITRRCNRMLMWLTRWAENHINCSRN